jgi:hypothetical protein
MQAQEDLSVRRLELREKGRAPTDAPITATIAGFMRLSGLGKSTCYGLIQDGHVESIMVGRRRLVIVASYYRYLAGKLAAAKKAP